LKCLLLCNLSKVAVVLTKKVSVATSAVLRSAILARLEAPEPIVGISPSREITITPITNAIDRIINIQLKFEHVYTYTKILGKLV
jgi:hypothetical protein